MFLLPQEPEDARQNRQQILHTPDKRRAEAEILYAKPRQCLAFAEL